ncbi:MAG: hypothetical protein Q9202_007391 [Teloschistes flavicans]
MGAELVEKSLYASSRVDELHASLQTLPMVSDAPSWSLKTELLGPGGGPRIAEAALSQPLCIAVLASYSARYWAILRAKLVPLTQRALFPRRYYSNRFYRGVHAKLASSPNAHAPRGVMMAIGASLDDVNSLCDGEGFAGRMQVAAVNSDSGVTLSGDEDAIEDAATILKAEGTYVRKLNMDTAYHSAHMLSCVEHYLMSLANCGIKATEPPQGQTTT